MAQHSKNFSFDDFEEQIADALEQNEVAMRRIYPGQIGGVVCRPSFEIDLLPVAPEDLVV